jgi:hypothetical protein
MTKEQGKEIFRGILKNLNEGEEHEARKGVDSRWNCIKVFIKTFNRKKNSRALQAEYDRDH